MRATVGASRPSLQNAKLPVLHVPARLNVTFVHTMSSSLIDPATRPGWRAIPDRRYLGDPVKC